MALVALRSASQASGVWSRAAAPCGLVLPGRAGLRSVSLRAAPWNKWSKPNLMSKPGRPRLTLPDPERDVGAVRGAAANPAAANKRPAVLESNAERDLGAVRGDRVVQQEQHDGGVAAAANLAVASSKAGFAFPPRTNLSGAVAPGGEATSPPRQTPIESGLLASSIKQCTDMGGLQRVVEEHAPSFSTMHAAAVWRKLAKMNKSGAKGADDVVVEPLQVLTRALIPKMASQLVVQILHSLGEQHAQGQSVGTVAHAAPTGVMLMRGELFSRAKETAGDLPPASIPNLMWAFSKMGLRPDRRLLSLIQARATATAVNLQP